MTRAIRVTRSQLRKNLRSILKKASGECVIEVSANDAADAKYIISKSYLDELLSNLESAKETVAIMADSRLLNDMLRSAETLDEDMRLGKLHSFNEAFE